MPAAPQRHRAGRPLTGTVLAHDPSPFSRYSGALAVGANGHVAVIWAADASSPDAPNCDGSGSGIFGRLLAADGTPSGRDFLINSTTTGNQHSPAIAGGQGGAVVVWISDPATNLYARRIAAAP